MEGDTDDSVTDDASAPDKSQKEEHERLLECQARAVRIYYCIVSPYNLHQIAC